MGLLVILVVVGVLVLSGLTTFSSTVAVAGSELSEDLVAFCITAVHLKVPRLFTVKA